LLAPPVGDEVKRQLWLAGPRALVTDSLLQSLIQTISVMFVRHFGDVGPSV
jgi:hypothetical protein